MRRAMRCARTSSLIRLAFALALADAPLAPPASRAPPRLEFDASSASAYPCRRRIPSVRSSRVSLAHRLASFARASRARLASSSSSSVVVVIDRRRHRTSGRNARKPSNKSSCPARHRRTLSTTTSAVNLRHHARDRAHPSVGRSSRRASSSRRVASRRVPSRGSRTFPA